jgi:hypothetical protein
MLRTVIIESRTKNQMMCTLDFLNGVDLDKAQLLDGFLHRFRSRTPSRVDKQPLSIQQKSTSIGCGN